MSRTITNLVSAAEAVLEEVKPVISAEPLRNAKGERCYMVTARAINRLGDAFDRAAKASRWARKQPNWYAFLSRNPVFVVVGALMLVSLVLYIRARFTPPQRGIATTATTTR